jgi:hypothetical protein
VLWRVGVRKVNGEEHGVDENVDGSEMRKWSERDK